jgi:hypothetical protein
MKKQANWFILPAVALGLGACDKKPEVKAPEVAAAVAETPAKKSEPTVAVVPAAPAVPAAGAEERAAKLGFVRYLPQDTEVVLSFYNGSKTAERVKGSKLWKMIEKEMKGTAKEEAAPEEVVPDAKDDGDSMEDAMEAAKAAAEKIEAPDEATDAVKDETATEEASEEDTKPAEDAKPADDPGEDPTDPASFAKLFGSEVTLALGKSTGSQLGNLFTLNARMSYFQMRGIAKLFAAMVKSGKSDDLAKSVMNGYTQEMFKDILNDPKAGIALVEKAQMPPIYLAFRTLEADRAAAATQVSSMLENVGMLGEMVEPVSVEIGGNKFTGSKILGSKIAATMETGREAMTEMMDKTAADRIFAAVAKKDIVILSGTVGDYTLVFVGSSTEDLKLADGVGKSLASGDALTFSDGYLSKDLAAIYYGQKEAMKTLIDSVGGIREITSGLRDGLAGAEGLGEMRELDAMFQIVADREEALRKLSGTEASGCVAFFEEGLKIESYGGTDSGVLDWKAPHKLAALGESEDVVMFADFNSDAVYDEKLGAYAEAVVETAYALAMKVSEAPEVAKELSQFQEMAKLFDTKFRPDLLGLWDAYSKDFSGSLGQEFALVVDLKGGAPAIPGMSQAVLDKAKIPRISMIKPVTDRTKIGVSWDKMNTSITSTLTKISQMSGMDIPMQKPMSSERGGNTTWFFAMPFLTDDFVPSVTVGDKWFAASTSKDQALELMAKADTAGPARSGFWFSMNFKALEKYSTETLNLFEENAETITGSPLPETSKKPLRTAISVLGQLDKMTVHSRREAQVLRSSIHIKTR